MPQWLSVAIGILIGVAVVAGAIFYAVWPYVQARAPKPMMPYPTEAPRDWSASNGWNGPDGASGL
jgi:hypothetical protein